jgi:hypothetical protein
VCTGHCTVQCPVHRQPRAKIQFSCALSGVHRTGTVDCPVRPCRVLKKGLQPAEPSQRLTLFPSTRCSLSLASPPRRRRSPPPATSLLRQSCAWARFFSLGEQIFPLSLLPLCSLFEHLLSTPSHTSSKSVNFCESNWWNEFKCLYCVSLLAFSSFGRVFPPQMAVSPKP